MPVAFVQALGTAQEKASDTSLAITVASLTITAGNTLFVGIAYEPGGTVSTVTNTGGTVTWTEELNRENVGDVEVALWKGAVTVGGTLTQIAITWAANNAAKAAVAGEFSGLGALFATATAETTGGNTCDLFGSVNNQPAGALQVGAYGWERPGTDDLGMFTNTADHGASEVGQDGTTGGGAATNITGQLGYAIIVTQANGYILRSGNNTSTGDAAGCGVIYEQVAAVTEAPYPYVGGGYYPTEG